MTSELRLMTALFCFSVNLGTVYNLCCSSNSEGRWVGHFEGMWWLKGFFILVTMGTEAVEMSRLKNGEAGNNNPKHDDQVEAEGFNGRSENPLSVGCDGNLGKASDGLEEKIHVSVSLTLSCVNEFSASLPCRNMSWHNNWQYHLASEKGQTAEGSDISGYVSKPRHVWWRRWWWQWLGAGAYTEECGSL